MSEDGVMIAAPRYQWENYLFANIIDWAVETYSGKRDPKYVKIAKKIFYKARSGKFGPRDFDIY